LKNKRDYEDCDSLSEPMISILSQKKYSKDLHDLIQLKHRSINGSIIEKIKHLADIYFILNYFSHNQTNIVSKEQKILSMNNLKQNNFLRISINSTLFDQIPFVINKDLEKYETIFFIRNGQYSVLKKSFKFLEHPYKSQCSHYDSVQTPFNSLSNTQCIRQCIKYYCELRMNCSCFALRNTINQMDNGFQNLDICQNWTQIESFDERYTKFCTKLCPIDCMNDEYITFGMLSTFRSPKLMQLTLDWDQSKPFIVNKEIPVMTFNGYFCYIGGLFGMWFGISANRLYEIILKNCPIFSLIIIYFKILLNICIENIYILRAFMRNCLKF